jgi:hypothetical protein
MLKKTTKTGAKVTSKHDNLDRVSGMYRNSLGFRWDMWKEKKKHGTCKEFVKRFRKKEFARRY